MSGQEEIHSERRTKLKIHLETVLANRVSVLSKQQMNTRDEECRCVVLYCLCKPKETKVSLKTVMVVALNM